MRDRRLGLRVPCEILVTVYIRDRPVRAMSENISDTGIFLEMVRSPRLVEAARDKETVAIELTLPGAAESIWAAGQVQHARGGDLVDRTGIRFTAIPRRYARMLREFCVETRRQTLTDLLCRIPGALLPQPT